MKVAMMLLGMVSVLSQNSYGFGSSRSSAGSAPAPVSAPSTPVVVTPPPSGDQGTGGLKVVINQADNFTPVGLDLLEKSRSVLEKVVNSEEFKQRVIHFTYQGVETFVQNNGNTNLQIYNQMMAGAEQTPVATPANNTMDLFVQLYTSSVFGRNVIGYTDPTVHTIFMNSYFFNSADPSGVAGNMMHEWMHKMGYDHDFHATAQRPSSVPYAIGYIAEELAAKYTP
jgi:hypothetical protein